VDVEEVVERAAALAFQLANGIVVLALLGDVLGINVFELLRQIPLRVWYIPREWIEMYYPLWAAMTYALLLLVLADTVFVMAYSARTGEVRPPLAYARYVALAEFLLSTWLFLLFRWSSLAYIAVMSTIALAYTAFVRGGE